MGANIVIRTMHSEDYAFVMSLWTTTEGVGLSDADTRENIDLFLARNSGLSFVAEVDSKIIGTLLSGHDGRRGFLYHLIVSPAYRRNGIGRRLVENCLAKLREVGIRKCHLFVFTDNMQGMDFWNKVDFTKRQDISICSKDM